ncbi:phosphoribulokinase [Pyrus ussuriensis x Pyrus communis]|uniref:Phosphoribulokinase n=1 Tax=Pyrus ussuriensis x Pyrus communis TaxID=2448454 RepID=A0A5N5GD77_9ROSA|nr:phosphoribulokinase [Pyrus ussuriensis x Pyrus communis]
MKRLFDSNMFINNITTVICLDDYHSLDKTGRKKKGVTTLDPQANDFDLTLDPIAYLFSVHK